MATHTFTIPLTDGITNVNTFFTGSKEDTTFITLTDGGNLNTVNLGGFGHGIPTEAGEGPGGNDVINIDLSGFNDDFSISIKSFDPQDTVNITGVGNADAFTLVGNVYTINYIGSDGAQHTLTIDVQSTNGTGIAGITIPCFAKGTMIETDQGTNTVENLTPGSRVLCGDGNFRPIKWIAKRYVSAAELELHPEFRPIRIHQNSLGDNRPDRDLVVSPQHRVLINDWRAELLFASGEVLVPAKYLVNDHSIATDYQCQDVTYYHFMLDSHQTVMSDGIETESFHPGDMALSGITDEARTELFALFPQLENNPESFGPTYRTALKSYEAATLFAPQ